jgi:hypothetical protein
MSLPRFAWLVPFLLFAPFARAADPAVEVRLKSVDALLARAEFVGGLAGKAEEAKQFAGLAKAFTNAKGLEGIDTTKDFGFYAAVTPDVADSPLVLMAPIKDEDAFLGLFANKLGLTPKKADGGVYSLDVPMVPKPVYFRKVLRGKDRRGAGGNRSPRPYPGGDEEDGVRSGRVEDGRGEGEDGRDENAGRATGGQVCDGRRGGDGPGRLVRR